MSDTGKQLAAIVIDMLDRAEQDDRLLSGRNFKLRPWTKARKATNDLAARLEAAEAALREIGKFAASHSGRDGQDVCLAALYRIAEESEAYFDSSKEGQL